MTIFVGSRYASGFLVTSKSVDDQSSSDFVLKFPKVPTTGNYVLRVVVEGDRLDALASEMYNDALQWWRIADANPSLTNVLDLVPGSILVVPNGI